MSYNFLKHSDDQNQSVHRSSDEKPPLSFGKFFKVRGCSYCGGMGHVEDKCPRKFTSDTLTAESSVPLDLKSSYGNKRDLLHNSNPGVNPVSHGQPQAPVANPIKPMSKQLEEWKEYSEKTVANWRAYSSGQPIPYKELVTVTSNQNTGERCSDSIKKRESEAELVNAELLTSSRNTGARWGDSIKKRESEEELVDYRHSQPTWRRQARSPETQKREKSPEIEVLRDDYHFSLSDEQTHANLVCLKCNRPGHIAMNCRANFGTFEDKLQTARLTGSKIMLDTYKLRVCSRCGVRGHEQRDCPRKLTPSALTTGSSAPSALQASYGSNERDWQIALSQGTKTRAPIRIEKSPPRQNRPLTARFQGPDFLNGVKAKVTKEIISGKKSTKFDEMLDKARVEKESKDEQALRKIMEAAKYDLLRERAMMGAESARIYTKAPEKTKIKKHEKSLLNNFCQNCGTSGHTQLKCTRPKAGRDHVKREFDKYKTKIEEKNDRERTQQLIKTELTGKDMLSVLLKKRFPRGPVPKEYLTLCEECGELGGHPSSIRCQIYRSEEDKEKMQLLIKLYKVKHGITDKKPKGDTKIEELELKESIDDMDILEMATAPEIIVLDDENENIEDEIIEIEEEIEDEVDMEELEKGGAFYRLARPEDIDMSDLIEVKEGNRKEMALEESDDDEDDIPWEIKLQNDPGPAPMPTSVNPVRDLHLVTPEIRQYMEDVLETVEDEFGI